MKHRDEVMSLLEKQIGNHAEVEEIRETANEVARQWVDPCTGGKESTNGLIYGLIQSGKTGVLTVTGAIAADEGYRTLIILTSDNDPLYAQTLSRVRQALPGVDIIGKSDFRDIESFTRRLKVGTCAIVMTKNGSLLDTLIENFKKARIPGLSCLIIDDEADQASLNTRASKSDGSVSEINRKLTEIRRFFDKNTYLQVTATPQALFLQAQSHDFRPKFTVLSHPGSEYVGGEDFFGDHSTLVREFDLRDVEILTPGAQPSPSVVIPPSLLRALDTFMIGATYKRIMEPDQHCAFLCHVSTLKADHAHIVEVMRKYKADLPAALRTKNAAAIKRLQAAYDDLAATTRKLRDISLDQIVERIAFLSPGIAVKLVNGQTDEDVALDSPYNLFVGGNKLGRGVTIRNLLVSYYGRNPRNPQADTVLQHARMYGYRRRDIGLLRLFLPHELHLVFSAINRMERSLRDLIARSPSEEFRGVFLEGGVRPTRRNVIVPGSVGVYSAGSTYNPAQVARDKRLESVTAKIDKRLEQIPDKTYASVPISAMKELISLVVPDESSSERVWNSVAIGESLVQFAKLASQTSGRVYVDRDRALDKDRRETQGILTGGEAGVVPDDQITLFMLRTKPAKGKAAVWWPQVRFPSGNYAFAFSV